ncbi:hypothetical protein ACNO5M_26490 [Vibrio owensii]|uniref:hypothetical protein n=1 Tax=Vibrio owensii TaxID=696485 RepID=UPI003AAEE521
MPAEQVIRAQQFIERAMEKYGTLYDYSQVTYVNQNTHVQIICSTHGVFHTSPKNFLAATKTVGCPFCSRKLRAAPSVPKVKKEPKEVKRCETDYFNVCGGTKKHQDILLSVFC